MGRLIFPVTILLYSTIKLVTRGFFGDLFALLAHVIRTYSAVAASVHLSVKFGAETKIFVFVFLRQLVQNNFRLRKLLAEI